MKYTYKAILGLIAGVIITFSACDTDELHDLNLNSQALSEIEMNFLFSSAELSLSDGGPESNRFLNWRTNVGYASYWMQHLSTLGVNVTNAGDKYFVNVEADEGPWGYGYGGVLKNLTEVIKQTGPEGFEEGRRKNTRAAARIIRAFTYLRLTDFYGNIPYTEANQGIEGIFFPKYDTQESVYTALFQELEEAGAAISTSNADDGFADADMIYQGDITKWKKWANSIMLKMAMQVSDVNATLAGEMVSKALAGGVFASNADIPWVPHSETPSQWVNQNGLSRTFIPGDGGQTRVMSKTLIDVLKGTDPNNVADDDPRLMIFTDGVAGDVSPLAQVGMPNGLDAGTLDTYTGMVSSDPNALFSTLNLLFFDVDEPYKLMSFAEMEFLQAEAKERGIGSVGGTAKSHYDTGVKAAMQMFIAYDASFTVSDFAVNSYLTQYPYTEGGANAMEMIGEQMWLNSMLSWWDGWNYWRRTNTPTITPVNYPGNITGGKIPTRLMYPNSEDATNSENMAAGGTTPNTHVGKVWWDVN